MANQILNPTFLDGNTSWLAGSGAPSVNETTIGAPGRIVMSAAQGLISGLAPLNGAQSVWVMGHFVGDALQVRFANNAGFSIEDVTVPLIRSARGQPSRGLASGFNFARGLVPKPAIADITRFGIGVVGADVRLMKPYASADGLEPITYQAGPHANPDLAYPAWPADLPAFQPDSVKCEPIPTRKGFTGDIGWEETRKITRSRRYKFEGVLQLDAAQHDRLMAWLDAVSGSFWFERPDTRETCLAMFRSDGEPAAAGSGAVRTITVGLQLRVP